MQINHLIFTRFNIQYDTGDTIGIQSEWLDERFHLFEQYCLPSIQKQTCQDFIWLLIGDIRTPEIFKKRIENYQSLIPQIRTYWVPFQKDAYHSFYKGLGKEYAKNHSILISTRFDNDDILSADHIERVQETAKKGITGIVSFPIGRQTFTQGNKSYKISYKQNHFLSRIETSGYETIMVFDHTQIPLNSLHLINSDEPMWEEIVHGNNIANGYQPIYHYFSTDFSDSWDLFQRWVVFQKNRVIRFGKTHFVFFHKR